MSKTHSHRIPFPHYIDHEKQTVFIKVSSWQGAMMAPKKVNQWYPGYSCELVSMGVLEEKEETT